MKSLFHSHFSRGSGTSTGIILLCSQGLVQCISNPHPGPCPFPVVTAMLCCCLGGVRGLPCAVAAHLPGGGDPHTPCSCPGFTCDTPGLWQKGHCASLCLRSFAVDGRRMSNRGFGSDCPCPSSCQPQARETHTDLVPGPKQHHFQGIGCPFGYKFMIKIPKTPQC